MFPIKEGILFCTHIWSKPETLSFRQIWNFPRVTEPKISFHLSLFSQTVTPEFSGLKIKQKTYFCLLFHKTSFGSQWRGFANFRWAQKRSKATKMQDMSDYIPQGFVTIQQFPPIFMGFRFVDSQQLLVQPSPVHLVLFKWWQPQEKKNKKHSKS